MAKTQSFADKAQGKHKINICPVCNGDIQYIKQVRAIKSPTGSWKYRTVNVAVCQCNEKEIYD